MATSFNRGPIQSRSVIAAKASKNIPVGTIMELSWSMPQPAGWIECDGRALNKDEYPELFAVIGTTFGQLNNGHYFAVPDMKTKLNVDCACGHNNSVHQLVCLICPVEEPDRMKSCAGYQPDNLLWLLENKDKSKRASM